MSVAFCPSCKRNVQTFYPATGDGSALVYKNHLAANGIDYCPWSHGLVAASTRTEEQQPDSF